MDGMLQEFRNHTAQSSRFLKYKMMLRPRQNGEGFWERGGGRREGKKRILRESEKDKGRGALKRETISSVFVTGAKTVQSRH